MSEYKLIYFDINGLAEPIRWALKLAGKDFEEERIPYGGFAPHKQRFPLGQVPIVYENGVELTQSSAITAYLCRKFGFVSEDEFLNYRSSEVAEIMTDSRVSFRLWFLTKDDDPTKAEKREDFANRALPMHFRKVAAILKDSRERTKGQGPFIAGKTLTWGDLILVSYIQIYTGALGHKEDPKNILGDFEEIQELYDAVVSTEAIAQWIANRPDSLF